MMTTMKMMTGILEWGIIFLVEVLKEAEHDFNILQNGFSRFTREE